MDLLDREIKYLAFFLFIKKSQQEGKSRHFTDFYCRNSERN